MPFDAVEDGAGVRYALKKACVARERLEEAKAEADYMQRAADHPNVMPLVSWSCKAISGATAARH